MRNHQMETLERRIEVLDNDVREHLKLQASMSRGLEEISKRLDRQGIHLEKESESREDAVQRLHGRIDALERVEASQSGQTRLIAGILTILVPSLIGFGVWLNHSIQGIQIDVESLRYEIQGK